MVKRSVRTAIEKEIRKQLGGSVYSVETTRDDAFEDDDVLFVTVTLEHGSEDVDPDEEIGLVRHLHPRLSKIGEEAFPLISFVSRTEEVS